MLIRPTDAFAWPLSTADYLGLLDPRWGRDRARVELVDETRPARTLIRPPRGSGGLR